MTTTIPLIPSRVKSLLLSHLLFNGVMQWSLTGSHARYQLLFLFFLLLEEVLVEIKLRLEGFHLVHRLALEFLEHFNLRVECLNNCTVPLKLAALDF